MPIIKNYGFLWEKKYIHRGGGKNNSGHLKGHKGSETIDFREQIGVYVLYDKDQNIIYVGQAGNGNATLFSRLKSHMKNELWNRWHYFSWIGFRSVNQNLKLDGRQDVNTKVGGFTYADALNEVEGILIEIIEPKLNKQSGKLGHATEYFQYIDESFDEITNHELMKRIDSLEKAIRKVKST